MKKYEILLKADVIIFTEIWIGESGSDDEKYKLEDYRSNWNNIGRGRGLASYYNEKFKHIENVNFEGLSLSKLESEEVDVIGIYRSQEGNVTRLITEINGIIKEGKTTVILGDFNICALAYPRNYVTQSLREMGLNNSWKSLLI